MSDAREFVHEVLIAVRQAARTTAIFLATVGLCLPSGCNPGPSTDNTCAQRTDLGADGSFVGTVAESAALIGLDFIRCKGSDRVRIFLTDGTVAGDTEYFEDAMAGDSFALVSKSGRAQIEGRVSTAGVEGTVTLPDGAALGFAALPAVDGAGLYEVVVNADGTWAGTTPGGAMLAAEAQQDGKIIGGTLTDPSGQRIAYAVRDLSRIFKEPVEGAGPDNYFVIVLPHGDALLGRGGVTGLKASGTASDNFIRLDLPLSEPTTPGTFVGRFQDLPDQIGLEFDEPDASGNTHLRVFVCDGQPAPDGRAEWFSGDFTGDFPDAAFAMTSVSGNATITNLELRPSQFASPSSAGKAIRTARLSSGGTTSFCEGGCVWCPGCCKTFCHDGTCICIEDCRVCCGCNSRGIGGRLTLSDGSQHQFYAVPVGEGAGIYEVKLEPGRMRGTSIQGGTLDLNIDGEGQVTGTLTAPDGTVFPYEGSDFGQAFSDPAKLASVPDTFVVLASPRGRFLTGSPGNAHGLVVIAIIAILIAQLPPPNLCGTAPHRPACPRPR